MTEKYGTLKGCPIPGCGGMAVEFGHGDIRCSRTGCDLHEAPLRRPLWQLLHRASTEALELAKEMEEYFFEGPIGHLNAHGRWVSRDRAGDWIKQVQALAPQPVRDGDGDDIIEWIVNDAAELGVKVGGRCLFLYKGCCIEYGKDDSEITKYRPVYKREFGECCHPESAYTDDVLGDPLDGDWVPLPVHGTPVQDGELETVDERAARTVEAKLSAPPSAPKATERTCGKCGKPAPVNELDPCLGVLPRVANACCGHGNPAEAYVQFENGVRLAGFTDISYGPAIDNIAPPSAPETTEGELFYQRNRADSLRLEKSVALADLAKANARIGELEFKLKDSEHWSETRRTNYLFMESERDSALTRIGEMEHKNGVQESKIWGLEAELKMVDGQEIKEANYAMGQAKSARNSARAEVETLKAEVERQRLAASQYKDACNALRKHEADNRRWRDGIEAIKVLCNTAPGGMLKAIVMSQMLDGMLDDSGTGEKWTAKEIDDIHERAEEFAPFFDEPDAPVDALGRAKLYALDPDDEGFGWDMCKHERKAWAALIDHLEQLRKGDG